MSAVATYEAIAPVYDAYTAHYDHEGWIADLVIALDRQGLKRGSLLDVACGTGNSFLPMVARDWKVTACDISSSMLALAREKTDGSVRLEVADMRELPVFGSFDLVWALDDAVNYLLGTDELEAALRGMRANLAPTGLLLFDTNALPAYRGFFAETHEFELEADRRLTWRGSAASDVSPGSICEAGMVLDGELIATHRQRHFPQTEVLGAIHRAGLECLDVYGHGFDGVLKKPLDEATHMKAVYIACARGRRS